MSEYPRCKHGYNNPMLSCEKCVTEDLRTRLDAAERANAAMREALLLAETAMAENEAYHAELDDADKRAKECEVEGDMFGWNFFKGKHSGIVTRSISQQAPRRAIASALSSTAAHDYIPREEHERVKAELERASRDIERLINHCDEKDKGLNDSRVILDEYIVKTVDLRADLALVKAERDAFTKHVGAETFQESVDVLLRTKQQDETKIEEMFNQIKALGKEREALRADLERVVRERDEAKNAAFQMHDGELVHQLRAQLAAVSKERDNQCRLKQNCIGMLEILRPKLAAARKERDTAHAALRQCVEALEETSDNCCECDACKSAVKDAQPVILAARAELDRAKP